LPCTRVKIRTETYKPSGWADIKVFGELGSTLNLADKAKVVVSGYPMWNEGVGEEKKYRGWEFHATSVEPQEQSASQKKAEDSDLPF